MSELIGKMYAALSEQVRGKGKLADLVRQAVKTDDRAALIGVCERIEKGFPVRKNADGQDENRAARNERLSALRMSLRSVCKTLDVDALTVKKVEGEWQVVLTDNAKSDGENGAGGEPGNNAPPPDADNGDAQPDASGGMSPALAKAVQATLDNLSNPAVLALVRAALASMAKG